MAIMIPIIAKTPNIPKSTRSQNGMLKYLVFFSILNGSGLDLYFVAEIF